MRTPPIAGNWRMNLLTQDAVRLAQDLARDTAGHTGLHTPDFDRIALACEPVWAIGTGVTATPEQAERAHRYVRSLVADQFGETVAACRMHLRGRWPPFKYSKGVR